MDRNIRTTEDVLKLLDGLFPSDADRWTTDAGSSWWDHFYADRSRPIPFFVAKPDENLVSYLDRGLITPGRALDLGCGPGRNALYLASSGFDVDAVDLSPVAIAWAEDRARETVADVRFHCGDAFTTELEGPYHFVYDSGCFHHLPPHRRVSYLALLDRVLAPGGHFGLACFAPGEMGGSELPDADLYRQASLSGGLAYTPDSLRRIFADLTELELRRMHDEPTDSTCFGEPFLWTALFSRPKKLTDATTTRRPETCQPNTTRPETTHLTRPDLTDLTHRDPSDPTQRDPSDPTRATRPERPDPSDPTRATRPDPTDPTRPTDPTQLGRPDPTRPTRRDER